MIPIRDENPTLKPPIATYVLIGMNAVVWAAVQGFGAAQPLAESLCLYGLIPGDLLNTVPDGTTFPIGAGLACTITGDGEFTSLLSSMFMHGSWLHIIGNMLFLWVFGDNVEDVMGPGRFVLFYVLCGLAAAGAQIATDPSSTVPMVGASGAIGGVMGAYAILFPRARVHLLIILVFYVTTVSVPAVLMLGYWFLLQLLSGVASANVKGGIAFWAHVGGFVAGVVLVFWFKRPDLIAARERLTRRYQARHRWL
jgi:membrane associated rhomboid family serine protease